MGNLKVGDQVFDERGRATNVTGVYDQPPNRSCVEVHFSDGSNIICDEEHLWYTETRAARISDHASVAHEPNRARRRRLAPEIIAKLGRVVEASSPDQTITIAEAAKLAELDDTDLWLRGVAAALGSVGLEQKKLRFHYSAQTVVQRKTYKAYPATSAYGALATKAAAGTHPTLSAHRDILETLARRAWRTDTVVARDLATLIGIPYHMACRWLATCGVAPHPVERQCELQVAEKELTRGGNTAHLYPRRALCEALACDGDRIILDQRTRRISGAVRTTREIQSTLRTASGHLNHTIPVAQPLQLPPAELTIPPYTLGAWLGDGCSWSGRVTSADPEVVSFVVADGYEVRQCKLACDAWKTCREYNIIGLARQLRPLGLLKRSREEGPSKRIPRGYLRSSEGQRRALLAGLLDTDGTVAPQGTTQFTTIIPGLADDVLELARSLGYRATQIEGTATLNGTSHGPKWTIAFTTQDPVFRLTRKLDALRARTVRHNPSKVRNRTIVDVRPVPSVPLRCITVDSPNHLYLAGRSMIPTHNTITLIGDAIEATRRGFQVFVVDPKRVEFLGLRSWPNVQMVATTVPQQVAVVHLMMMLMNERYRQVEEDGVSDTSFQPILLIIDEYRQLYGNVKAWWRSIKVTGMPTECPIFDEIGSLLRMAAYCRIHVDLATQRPDAEFLSGETRDNFSARAATGRLSADGAEMMFGNAHVGVGIPLNVRGRGTIIGLDDRPKEVQFLYTPDPRRPRDDDDRELLEALRPETTAWPRLEMQLPDVDEFIDEIVDVKKTNLEWEQIQRARFVPATSADGNPQPDAETSDVDETATRDDGASDGPSEVDPDEAPAYRPPTSVPAGMVSVGDLLNDDERGWLTVTDVARDSELPEVQLEWRDNDGKCGDLLVSRSELVEIRRLAD